MNDAGFTDTAPDVGGRDHASLLSMAYRAIVVALLAGAGETLLHVVLALRDHDMAARTLLPVLIVRGASYLAVFVVALRMVADVRWARGVLVFGLGTLGLASLVVEPLTAVLTADRFADLFAHWTPAAVTLGVFRGVHIAAVLVALTAMIQASGGSSADRTSDTVVTGRSQTEPRQT
ncbi:MAG: hypothetical protein JWN03_3570 [Nocardia sp.]|uniref:hypothetical protein n=1 Tax=Nocardia sp. TaxID=1821 RepID=UPI00261731AA|nr:hypothetical protein [Nocardia sp.]MCU1643295.1 hypothetical protein [Nocardia sp.]